MSAALLQAGHPLLGRRARPVPLEDLGTPKLLSLVRRLLALMRRAGGVGLAANQAGVNRRIFVMGHAGRGRYPRRPPFPFRAFVNPRITARSPRRFLDWEGCLSVPGWRGRVPRSSWVRLSAWTPEGERVNRIFRGFEGRVVQHEVDHLEGRLYLDRMEGFREWLALSEFNRRFGIHVRDHRGSAS